MSSPTKEEKEKALKAFVARIAAYMLEKRLMRLDESSEGLTVNTTECIYEEEDLDVDQDVIRLEDLETAPAKLDDLKADVQDPLEEVNLGEEGQFKPVYVSELLPNDVKEKFVKLLHEFKGSFAWEYHEMPGLPRELVEHNIPIMPGYRPFKQPPRRMSTEVELQVKEEIERLLEAKFIRTARYVTWLSNIVPVVKKNGRIRPCIDFRNLNLASPKDEYPMPMADLMVDGAARHKVLSFMDGHSGYNQIYINEEDTSKTAFRCPGALGTYEWVVMPNGLKNAGATYQRAMNAIFHHFLGVFMEVYIDDVVIKSQSYDEHLDHLRRSFQRMEEYGLKMNPLKCAFGVSAGKFLGFLVHQRGIEIDQNKAKAIINTKPPSTKKELQQLLGSLNYLRRFISNLAGKIKPFSPLLKLKEQEKFVWEESHQHVFDEIKGYLTQPPVLMPPIKGKALKLYISASEDSIGCLLAQDNEQEMEQAVYYLSRLMTSCETRYTPVEKLCLALYFSVTKLRHYILPVTVYVMSRTDLVKYMLTRPILRGRIGKWALALMEFSLKYVPQKAVKGQAIADFLTSHPGLDLDEETIDQIETMGVCLMPWILLFDGSRTQNMSGCGIVITSPEGLRTEMSFQFDFSCTNNQAEYEAIIIGLEILREMGARHIKVVGDSKLVINHLAGTFKCYSEELAPYYMAAMQLLDDFDDVVLLHVPRSMNGEANSLAQASTGLRLPQGVMSKAITITKRLLPSVKRRGLGLDVFAVDPTDLVLDEEEEEDAIDWRTPIIEFLRDPRPTAPRKLRRKAVSYILVGEDLYKKSLEDDLLLRCIAGIEVLRVMAEVHEGICGAHQSGIKMRWLIRRYGYYWPTILEDCIKFAKGCQPCQMHGNIQHVPADSFHPVVKPWPFRGWAMDIIGQITPPSTKRHEYILVATDYFTKWAEAIPMKSITQQDVIRTIRENIIHRFGIPQHIVADRGSVFYGNETLEFAGQFGIQVSNSSPYYPQGNGQAESTNKVLKGIISRMVEDNPRDWHNLLSEALWAYRTSRKSATKVTPYMLVYGHDAVLPMEITVKSARLAYQNDLSPADYTQAMLVELEDLDDLRLKSYDHLMAQKLKVARAFDKRVRRKSFAEGDLVWKTIYPLGSKDSRFGKWSPTWEGPFQVWQVCRGNVYLLMDLEGEMQTHTTNGKYLKHYVPSMWEGRIPEEEQRSHANKAN